MYTVKPDTGQAFADFLKVLNACNAMLKDQGFTHEFILKHHAFNAKDGEPIEWCSVDMRPHSIDFR